jgi:hypothetical protein
MILELAMYVTLWQNEKKYFVSRPLERVQDYEKFCFLKSQ